MPSAAARVVENHGFEYRIEPPPEYVESASIPARWPADAPGSEHSQWRIWLIDTQVDRREGRTRRYQDYAYEAISPELVGEAAKFEITFRPEFQSLVLHDVEVRRGEVWTPRDIATSVTLARREAEFEQDLATGSVSALLLLTDVRVRDVVRIRYSIEGVNPILNGQTYEQAAFGWEHPMLDRRLRVLFDRDVRVLATTEGDAPEPRVERRRDHQEWTYRATRSAPIRDEEVYPVWFNPYPTATLAPEQTWAEVASWALQLHPPHGPLPDELHARIQAWNQLPEVDQKVAAALEAVQEEVRYFGIEVGENSHRPHEPAEVWERRFGDCKDKARLLSAILGEMGISASPALVSTRRGKSLLGLPPAGALFDHMIVKVRLDDSVLWLDPTRTQQRGSPRAINSAHLGVALPVAAGVDGLESIAIPPASINETTVHEVFTPQEDGASVLLRIETRYKGAAAESRRRDILRAGSQAMSEGFADFYRRRFGALETVSPISLQDDPASNELVIGEHYRLESPWTDSSTGQRVLDVFADSPGLHTALPNVQRRAAPLPLVFPLQVDHTVTVTIPEGWNAVSSPVEGKLEDDALSFEYSRSLTKTEVVVRNRLTSKAEVVAAPDVGGHFSLRRAINEALSWRFVLTPPGEDPARGREEKLNSLLRGLFDED